MPEVIRWEDPPTEHGNTKHRQSKYQPTADALRSRPGQWALIQEGRTTGSTGGLAHRIRNGWGPFVPPGAFETKVRGPVGGPAKLYARYVGDGGQP